MTVTAASIQLEAAEVNVAVNKAHHSGLDGVWFLTLSTGDGYVALGGSLEELAALAGRITDAILDETTGPLEDVWTA